VSFQHFIAILNSSDEMIIKIVNRCATIRKSVYIFYINYYNTYVRIRVS